ncbi:MAG: chalcone isomerase family protein [Bdellovibrionota bacterium]
MKKLMTVVSTIAFSLTLSAQTLTTNVGDKKYDTYSLASSADLKVDKDTMNLKPVSHGIRKKKLFALLPVKVYYAELLAAKPEALVKTDSEILTSLNAAGPVQLRLTMLRDLPAKKISDSFVDALKANEVTVDSGDMKTVLGHISEMSEFKQGEIFSIVGQTKLDKGFLYLQKPNGEIITVSGSNKLVEQMFSIWLGKPVDDKLAELKKELLK